MGVYNVVCSDHPNGGYTNCYETQSEAREDKRLHDNAFHHGENTAVVMYDPNQNVCENANRPNQNTGSNTKNPKYQSYQQKF